MARMLKVGDKVRRLTICSEINRGAQAVSYRATAEDGRQVFLKQYKSPSITVPWYKNFISYQQKIRERIDSSNCKHFSYSLFDAFEHERCFFQSFEFLDHSDSLSELLSKSRKNPTHIGPEQRLIVAKVLLAGVDALHKNRIVHSDLKPDNVMMIRDESIVAGYRLKLIDMDFSVLSDLTAPWHGHQGYFGTPGYFSPEHLTGKVPTEQSDVFSIGLMLYEILASHQPYQDLSDEEYHNAVLGFRAKPPSLIPGVFSGDDANLVLTIHRCLHPELSERPTAMQVNRLLNDRLDESSRYDVARSTYLREKAEIRTPRDSRSKLSSKSDGLNCSLVLRADAEHEIRINVATSINQRLAAKLGSVSTVFDIAQQFRLYPIDSIWSIDPNHTARNSTFLNGRVLESPEVLHGGDIITIGNAKTGTQNETKITVLLCGTK